MLGYVGGRILLALISLLAVALVTYALGFYGPGDPLRAHYGQDERVMVSEEALARLRQAYGLDRPFLVQYVEYMGRLVQGDLGKTIATRQPLNETLAYRFPITAQLGLAAFVVLVLIGVPLGILAAIKQNTWVDYLVVSGGVFLQSIPVFVLAPLALIVLVLHLKLFPQVMGWTGAFTSTAILPVLLLAAGPMVVVIRQTRAGVIEALGQDYIRTARAKGLPERWVILRHVVKNGLTPAVTSLGLLFSALLTGSLFLEEIFAIPGFGYLTVTGYRGSDYPTIVATTVVSAVLIIGANLVVDLLYMVLDPRVRYE